MNNRLNKPVNVELYIDGELIGEVVNLKMEITPNETRIANVEKIAEPLEVSAPIRKLRWGFPFNLGGNPLWHLWQYLRRADRS